MTAHIVYTTWDRDLPCSLSPTIIGNIIRRRIGFDGLLMSDDLDMKALRGDIPSLAAAVVAAGCDLALNCWGRIEEMRGITEVLDEIRPESRIRSEEHTSEIQSLMRIS